MTIRYGFVAIMTALLAAVGVFLVLHHPTHAAAENKGPPPVPVTTAKARTQDVPVYLRGIGTVQAFNTVDVKARVSGTLMSVPVQEGQEVARGTVVAVIDPRPYKAALDQAVAQRQQDVAQLGNAQLDLNRYQNLASSSFASRQQVDTQKATVDRLQAAIAGDSAAVETAQLNVEFCTIRAPIDGRISLREVDPGNLIEAGNQSTGILSITQDHPISVVFTLPEQDLSRVQAAASRGEVTVLADDANSGGEQSASGRLQATNNHVDVATGTIQLKATFDNADNRLWPGEFVNVRLLADTIRHAITVPHQAVQHGPDGLFVFIAKPDKTVQRQDVTISQDDGQTAAVSKGLTDGQTVVASGQSRLGQGTRIVENTQDQATR